MWLTYLELIAKFLSIATGGIASLWGLYKYVVKPLIVKSKQIDEASLLIRKVYDTLGPNGGTSFYDKVHAIDRRTSATETRGVALNSSLGIIEFYADAEGNCIKVNEVLCKITNRVDDDFLGQNWRNVLEISDHDRVINDWQEMITLRNNYNSIVTITDHRGDPIKLIISIRPYYDSSNKLIGYLGTGEVEE